MNTTRLRPPAHPRFALLASALLAASLTLGSGCAKHNADAELEAARKALADAQSKRASDCDHEHFQAAEAALAEASKLADGGDADGAKQKAVEAKQLAEQAQATALSGCKEKVEDVKDDSKSENANADANLGDDSLTKTVYFDYNDASVREDGKTILSQVAQVLAKQSNVVLEIEGHCDVRGSTEYNLSLGERRAHAVEKYLMAQGVQPKQLQVISYGEERPVDLGTTEAAYAKNRRAELHKLK